VVADQLSRLLFCPSRTAVENSRAKGLPAALHVVGDVMCDELRFVAEKAQTQSKITGRLGLTDRSFLLATVHRAENTDDPARLRGILRRA
jgi:UDP-N-acetylglucosamine 2-epimerase